MDGNQTEEGSANIPEEAIKEHETILREYRERTFDRMLKMFRQKESTKMNNISTYVEISGLMTAYASALFVLNFEQIGEETRIVASWPIIISVFIGLALYYIVWKSTVTTSLDDVIDLYNSGKLKMANEYIFQSVSESVNYLENMSYGVIRLLLVQATLVVSGFVIIAIGGLI